jgi:hypothetical protein
MKSTGRYVHHRIATLKGKDAYLKAMRSCIGVIALGFTDLSIVKTKVGAVREEANSKYISNFFNDRKIEVEYHNMAVDQALEIVNTLEARFITGLHDPEPRAYKNSTMFLNGTEDLFE